MRIGIIGAGNVGGGLAAAASNADATRDADVVVLAVPHGVVGEVISELGEALDGKVVIDATNPLNETYTALTTAGISAAEQLQQRLPNAKVVKALNTVFASRYADPTDNGEPLTALVAGDDATAKQTVSELVESLGLRPVAAGSLRMARALEEIAFLNITLNAANGWPWQSHFALVGPTA